MEEFSLLSARLLELLEEVARRAKGSIATFGGIHLILLGSCCQLLDSTPYYSDSGDKELKKKAA